MSSGNIKSLVVKTNNAIPALIVAIIGFGLALFTGEISRMSSLQNIAASGLTQSIANFAAAFVLIALVIVYRTYPKFRIHRQRPVGILIGIGISFCVLYNLDVLELPQSDTAFLLTRCILSCLTMTLFACWAEILFTLSTRQAAVIVALSFFTLGGANTLSTMLKSGGAYTIVALTPLLSMLLLYWFKDQLENDDAFQRSKHTYLNNSFEIDHCLINKQATFFNSCLVFLLPLLFLPFIFGIIHNAWIPAQDGGTVSTQIQLGAALGTILAGGILLLLITYFWGRRRLELYNLIILPILILTLFLTTLVEGSLSIIYITPLNIVQKCTLFITWMAPYLIPCKKSPLVIWGVAELFYQMSKGFSTLAAHAMLPDNLLFITCIASAISVISVVIGIMLDQNKDGFLEINNEQCLQGESSANEDVRTPQIRIGSIVTKDGSKPIHGQTTSPFCTFANQETSHPRNDNSPVHTDSSPASSPPLSSKQIVGIIAQEFRLTQREEEVLELLAQGMKASAIGEDLFISTSTAKSHIRNIYAKLDIHTQSELLLLVHQKESESR